MTGPEHYAEAERLLADAIERWKESSDEQLANVEGKGGRPDDEDLAVADYALRAHANMLAEAHVHATLALTAATALFRRVSVGDVSVENAYEVEGWQRVAGVAHADS
jgi:hypothetical protein